MQKSFVLTARSRSLIALGIISISCGQLASDGMISKLAGKIAAIPGSVKDCVTSTVSCGAHAITSATKTGTNALSNGVSGVTSWIKNATPQTLTDALSAANPTINDHKLHTYWKSLIATSAGIIAAYKLRNASNKRDEERFLDGSILDDAVVARSAVLTNLHKEYMQHLKFYRHEKMTQLKSTMHDRSKAVNLDGLKAYLDELKSSFIVLLNNNRTYWERFVESINAIGHNIPAMPWTHHEHAPSASSDN